MADLTKPDPKGPLIAPTFVGGLPPWSATARTGQVTREKLANTAKKVAESNLSCAALDALLPIIYGEQIVGGLIANAIIYQGNWVFWVIWCEGEVDSIQDIQLNNGPLPVSTITPGGPPPYFHYYKSYKGIEAGEEDAYLKAAMRYNGFVGFAEKMPGVAYSVLAMSYQLLTAVPNFTARIRGIKVYDPRDSTQFLGSPSSWKWSNNPSLIAANFLSNKLWGAGLDPVWSTVVDCANANDALVGTEKSRLANMLVDREAFIDSWVETMRAAASCFFVFNQTQVKFIPDRDANPVRNYSHENGEILELSQPMISSAVTLPTVIEVQYTDTTSVPWQTLSADPVFRPGVREGTTPYRKSVVQFPWVTRRSQANREAIERMNKLWLRAVTFQLHVLDEGLRNETGDIISVTYPEAGFTNLPMRVLTSAPTDKGWMLTCERHDPGAYSSTVQSGPTIPNTTLPSPDNPPIVTGLLVSEQVDQMQTGLFASRLHITWDDMTLAYPFVGAYSVTLRQGSGGSTIYGPITVPSLLHEFVTPPLTENLLYEVAVQIISVTNVTGAAATKTITNSGKLARPTDVPSITGIEVGGEVRLQWTPATDLDLTAHEIRYGSTSSSWSTATLLDRIAMPAVRYETRSVPAGNWRFFIKGLDSVHTAQFPYGQESVNAAFVDIAVTSDATSAAVTQHDFTTAATLTNMTARTGYWVTDFGQTWAALFPNAMNTYTNPLFTYHTAGTSVLVTEAFDVGQVFNGTWVAQFFYVTLDGVTTATLELSTDGANWTVFTTNNVKFSARFVRLRLSCTGTLIVTGLGSVAVTVVPRKETSPGPIAFFITKPTTVELAGTYIAARSVQLTPVWNTFVTVIADRILVAPEHGLFFTTTHVGSGNLFTYWSISNIGRTIVSGDFLEFDVYVMPNSADVTSIQVIGGVELDFNDATNGRSLTLVDQVGVLLTNYNPALNGPVGTWQHRKISLAPAVGKNVGSWDIVCESNVAGVHSAIYRNMLITNGSGVNRQIVWLTSGEPAANVLAYQSGSNINIQAGPANSFLAYAFDSAGARIGNSPNPPFAYWTFEGI